MIVPPTLKLADNSSLSPGPKLDPEKFFRGKYQKAVKNASGLELFAYKVIPYSLIKSFVLTFDPTVKFQISPYKVTPGNRTRMNSRSTLLDRRVNVYIKDIRTGSSLANYGGLGRFGPIKWLSGYTEIKNFLGSSTPEYRRSVDTTRRTRPVGSNYGEFEKFKFDIRSPPRKCSWFYDNKISSPGSDSTLGWSINFDVYTQSVGPTGASISKSAVEGIRTSATTYANSLLTQHSAKMLAGALPTARRYSLWRNITELKDVPRSILTFRKTAFDLSQLERALFSGSERKDLLRRTANGIKDLPNEWLSYWFGWRTLYKDILDLVSTPQRAAKEVNRLLSRSGKPTSYRSTIKKLVDTPSATPLFSYDFLTGVYNLSTTAVHKREAEIRLVLNATFDFPRVDIPYFKKEIFLKKLGVYPSISDVYELTPWSWLLDWFTGLGDYLELIEAVNKDPSLINFGFITAVVKGEHTTNAKYRTQSTIGRRNIPAAGTTTYVDNWFRHSSTLSYEVQVRKDIPTVTGVSRTTDLSSLTTYQKSILGAILSQRVLPR